MYLSADVPYPPISPPYPSHLFPSLPSPRLPHLPYSTLPPLSYFTLPSTTLPSHPFPYLPTFPRTPIIHLHSLHPLPSPLIPYPTLSSTLPNPSGLSRPYPTILSNLLLVSRIPSPTYLPSHSYPTLAFPAFRSSRIPPLASPSLAPPSLSVPPLSSTLPYHIPPDRSRGRNVSFPATIGYLNPSLLYPPLPCRPNIP